MAQESQAVTPETAFPLSVEGFLQRFRHLPLGVERAWLNTKQYVVALHAGQLCSPKRVTLKREYDPLDAKEKVTAGLVIPGEQADEEVVVVADQFFLESHDLVFLDPEHVPGDRKDRLAHEEVLACLGALQIAESGIEVPLS